MASFVVYGRPAPKGSFKAITRPSGSVYLKPASDGERAWRSAIAWAARAAHVQKLGKPAQVKIHMDFYLPAPQRPSKIHGAVKRPSIAPPDVDKLCRSVLDALTGIAYDDDCQVVTISASKYYADPPHVRINVSEELS